MIRSKLSQQILAHLAKVLGRPVQEEEHPFVVFKGADNTMRVLCNGIQITTNSVTLLHNGVPVQKYTFDRELQPTDRWDLNGLDIYITVDVKTE